MPISYGPKVRERCPSETVWTASSGRSYCERCNAQVELRKDGKPRAHYRVYRRVYVTGSGLPGF